MNHLKMTLLNVVLYISCLFFIPMPSNGKPPPSIGNILLYPYGHCMNSHLLTSQKLAQILVDRDYNVSLLVSDKYDNFIKRDTISLPRVSGTHYLQFQAPSNFKPVCEYDTMDFMLYSPIKERFSLFVDTSVKYCEKILQNKLLMSSLKEQQYDLVIFEALDPCSRILADYIDVPFIPLLTAGLGHWDGNPRNPSYIPAAIGPFLPQMNFFQRVGNVVMKLMYEYIPVLMDFYKPFEELKQRYNLNTSLYLSDTLDRATVKFVNSHTSVDYPAPVEPDTILVGGFAIEEPKGLDLEMEEFMSNVDEEGLIVVSFGTLTKRFDEKWTRLFMEAFADLPQKVIWRYTSTDDIVTKNITFSSNVKLTRWLPQVDILASNKTKLFVTHCGLNGALEAAHYGIPVVAIPLSGDHFHHASKLTDYGKMGLQVDVFTLTSQRLRDAITTVLKDPKYKQNALSMSERMNDQPITPTDKIYFWVDYVIRHKQVLHLKSVSHTLTWYQYLCLDIMVFFTLIAVTFFSVIIVVLSLLSKAVIRWIGQIFRSRKLKLK